MNQFNVTFIVEVPNHKNGTQATTVDENPKYRLE
jgi:hypothetical protein